MIRRGRPRALLEHQRWVCRREAGSLSHFRPRVTWPVRVAAPCRPFSQHRVLGQASIQDVGSVGLGGEQADFSDVTIVGGGVVGLALATSLACDASFRSCGATITLIEGASLDGARQWSLAKQGQDSSRGAGQDWENRVIYLTEENRLWLDEVGVTPYLVPSRLGPVHSMQVTDGVSGASLTFDVPSPASNRMGTMVEISNLQQAMLCRIEALTSSKAARVQIIDSSRVEAIEAQGEQEMGSQHVDSWPVVRHSASSVPLKSRLLVGADGNNSPVRMYAGIKTTGWQYGRMGVVATMRTGGREGDERTAHQRFLPTGTVAWLPLASDCASLVWTLPPDMAKAVTAMEKDVEATDNLGTPPLAHLITAAFRLPWESLEAILNRLVVSHKADKAEYDWLVPMIEELLMTSSTDMPLQGHAPTPVARIDKGSVAAFPLKLSHAECYLGSSLMKTTFAESGAGAFQPSAILERIVGAASSAGEQSRPVRGRTALIGDAAHTIHPLAGQGLNLGLADSRSLSAALVRAVQVGGDLGSPLSLSSYPKERYLVNQAMLSAVDHLHWLFVTPPPGDPRNGVLGNLWSHAVVWGRSSGFEILNELSGVKRALMGFAGSDKGR